MTHNFNLDAELKHMWLLTPHDFYENKIIVFSHNGKIIKRKVHYNKQCGLYVLYFGYKIFLTDFS